MQFGFSYIGLIWLAMLFIPNFIWTKNKPEGYDGYASKESRILLAFEREAFWECRCVLQLIL